jgi:hypothetical protein
VGLIARELEAAGIVTTSVSAARDITAAARMPRAVFVDFPLGHTTGKVAEPELTLAIVRSALELTVSERSEQLVDLPFSWAATDNWKDGVFTAVTDSTTGEATYVDDRTERLTDPQFQAPLDADAASVTHDGLECAVCAGIDF